MNTAPLTVDSSPDCLAVVIGNDALFALVAEWRKTAEGCDGEILRSQGDNPTLYISATEKANYEQAARTFRHCAGEIEDLLNPCLPPLGCSIEEFRAFVETLEIGERVIERGKSGMKGETGTVVMSKTPGHGKCVKWDTVFCEGSGMVTSITGGTRRLALANSPDQAPVSR